MVRLPYSHPISVFSVLSVVKKLAFSRGGARGYGGGGGGGDGQGTCGGGKHGQRVVGGGGGIGGAGMSVDDPHTP